jgi:3-oxoadipate enol-lactonase
MTTRFRTFVAVATELVAQSSGEGLPFLWGHGLLSSMASEDSSGPLRWATSELPGVRLIRWDARGHGGSPTPTASGECRWPNLARDALELADRQGLGRFSIGGASMGAATALWVATMAPDRIDRLVLALPPTAWESRGRTARLYRIGGVISKRLPVGGSRRRGVVLQGASESDLPDPEAIRSITVPTLILAWRFDPVHPVSTAERLRDLLPAADLHVTARPLDVNGWLERLREFLAR